MPRPAVILELCRSAPAAFTGVTTIPTISATQSETDRTFWGRAALIVPVNDTLAMVPQVEIRDQDSNYEISRFDDFSALVGLQKRF